MIHDGQRVMRDGLLTGWTPVVWATMFFMAVGGLVVALVLKYADNIAKLFANAISITVVLFLSVQFLGHEVPGTWWFTGAALVTLSTFIYSMDTDKVALPAWSPCVRS